ncbi:OLC1v1039168C1 [Oldenlandia corymbosa var. corymbosa]|uniref:OLC1v1039168C1 n=1 Tax=Oldenlandia corymbosa var. corymbosa TaxID=529605 RepID=A0AAV1D2H4_OLDCO|nr:OLC1v1039168C1 [Oldenlandia corymbosa var. corymbosa]
MAAATRYAVVTGANKGVGFEVVRQLVSHGIIVVLTARDEKRGLDALHKLKESGGFFGDRLLFHQLDVADSSSVDSLAGFIKNQFGRLDILVNNAGVLGCHINEDKIKASSAARGRSGTSQVSWGVVANAITESYELAIECFQINYHGAKIMVQAFLPLLQLSHSARIVNVSSDMGNLESIPSEWAKGILNDVDNLTEERVDDVLNVFLKDFKEGSLKDRGWPRFLSAYTVSKAALNAYTRILAKKHHNIQVNCVCPGFAKTDMNLHSGTCPVEECAGRIVKVALQPDDGPSGLYFVHGRVTPFCG